MLRRDNKISQVPQVVVSAIQINTQFMKINKNFAKAERYLSQAVKQGAKFVLFPEYFLTGVIYKDVLGKIPLFSELISRVSRWAKKYKIYIIAGSIVEKDRDRYYNTTAIISPKGEILDKYRKKALVYNELDYLERDKKIVVVSTPFAKIGVVICWDIAFPEIIRKVALKGADIIFCPANWGIGGNPLQASYKFSIEKKYMSAFITARAFENELGIVFANVCGRYTSPIYSDRMAGQTQICYPPFGTIAKISKSNEEGVVTGKIDMKHLNAFRKNYLMIKDYKFYKKIKVIK